LARGATGEAVGKCDLALDSTDWAVDATDLARDWTGSAFDSSYLARGATRAAVEKNCDLALDSHDEQDPQNTQTR